MFIKQFLAVDYLVFPSFYQRDKFPTGAKAWLAKRLMKYSVPS